MFSFLNKLVDSNQTGLLILTLILLTIFALGTIASIVFLIKFIISKAKLGIKIGDKELNLNKSGSEKKSFDSSKTNDFEILKKDENIQNFISVTTTIISFSIENGHETSLKRQKLFDCQLSIIKRAFDILQMLILTDYIKKSNSGSYELVSLLLKQAFEIRITSVLEDICRADKLAEKTKESLIGLNRAFIDTAYNHVCFELQKISKTFINESEIDNAKILTECMENLLACIEIHKDSISKSIISTLERVYEEAILFMEDIQECNEHLNSKINTVLKAYFDNTELFKELPNEWINTASSLPPVEVVGVKKG